MNLVKDLMIIAFLIIWTSCNTTSTALESSSPDPKFTWDNATVYFLMTDRFYDGNPENNFQHTTDNPPAPYRGYMGGDIRGITQKIKSGYFTDLGVNAIWMTPLVEQIKGSVDEGTGTSFGFHGYWTRDWTALDSKFGTINDLKELVQVAHSNDIRILIDVVANHTGPVTPLDSQWPDEWVKTGPRCTYQSAETTINCTLVENLPDIRTESQEEVELPPFLIEKWDREGRKEKEIQELDEWFATTGLKRTPVNYILKWLVDFVKEYGVDGFRVDTAKHTEETIWSTLFPYASEAYEKYKEMNSDPVLDQDTEFYMLAEVYNYYISGGRKFNYGDREVDFFDHGFKSLVNFDFKTDAHKNYEEIFSKYDGLLHGELKGKSVLNYISSHDDGQPYDVDRKNPIDAGTKLILCPGGVQIYYGDETARSLSVEADGDARLRSFMNWEELENNEVINGFERQTILTHWQKLGRFRNVHPAIGGGKHEMISQQPYLFKRTLKNLDYEDKVVIGLGLPKGTKKLNIEGVFEDGVSVHDAYANIDVVVKDGQVELKSPFDIVLLEAVQ